MYAGPYGTHISQHELTDLISGTSMYRGRGSPSVATTVPGASSAWPSLYLFLCFSSSSDDHHSTACAFFSEPDDPPWVVDFRFDIDGPWTGLQVICNFRCEPEMTITTVIFIIFIPRVIVVAVRAMLWQTPSSFLSSFFCYNRYPTPTPTPKEIKANKKKAQDQDGETEMATYTKFHHWTFEWVLHFENVETK